MISAIVLAAGEIVLGAHAEAVRKQVRCDREQLILNPEYADGISTSIQAGLRAISGEAALIVLADQPFVRSETIDLAVEDRDPDLQRNSRQSGASRPLALRRDHGIARRCRIPIFNNHTASIANLAVDD